jgi:hypothetical protein
MSRGEEMAMARYSVCLRFGAVFAVAWMLASCGTESQQAPVESPRQPRGSSGNPSTTPPPPTGPGLAAASCKVFAVNRRGMSFPDRDFSVFAIFPPANFLRAQVVQTVGGRNDAPTLLDDTQIELRYSAVADPSGSINRTSAPKTNFWNYADTLYRFLLPSTGHIVSNEGVHGVIAPSQFMPGAENTPQPFTRFDETNTFTAPWIPITPIDDAGAVNNFPRFNVDAVSRVTGEVIASTTVVLPVAHPMDCASCHATGSSGANRAGIAWSTNPDRANQGKENVMRLHDALHGIYRPFAPPVMCVECHYSPVADPDERGPYGYYQQQRRQFSISIHAAHALGRDGATPSASVPPNIPENGNPTCTVCHGGDLPYFRDSMARAGIKCQDCHGGMIAVAKSPLVGADTTRTPFVDAPRCESCHTGDEVGHLGNALVLRKAFEDNDAFAAPRIAANRRFAEEQGKIYRTSVGHGGVACISCHGSPHAIWPVQAGTPDDMIPTQLQGHGGAIGECVACHRGGAPLTMDGPHGLHNIADDEWIKGHAPFYTADRAVACQACHGDSLAGGYLSRALTERAFTLPSGRRIVYAKGQQVGCADCHAMPR